ncbi:MAG: right-handed parallel beta-helix repeat-containing protein [Rhodocyclaceae bacterium]|nr:right-handed parallel beta-helix repeat-containing protein [Rhodocyclaceae bacterium]
MHSKFRYFNLLLIITLAFPLLGQKAYFVSPNGNNSNDGSIGKPWQSINYALGKIFPGDTIYLREGTYFELVNNFVRDGEPNKWITIRNYPNEKPILSGNGQWTVIEFKNRKYYHFQGLEITNAVWSGFNGTNYHYCKISNCVVHGIGPSSGTAVGIYVSGTPGKPDSSTHNIVENNIIYDCYGEGIYIGNDAHSLPPDGSPCNFNLIRGNEIYRCVDGIDIKTGSRFNRVIGNHIHDCNGGEYSAGIIVYEHTEIDSNVIDHNINYGIFVQGNHNRITRNYIYKNKSYGILVTGYESLWNNYKDSGDDNVILNNTIVDNGNWGMYLYGDANQDSRGTILKNNIIAFNGEYQLYATEYGTVGLVLDSNDWFTQTGKLMYFRSKECVDLTELDASFGANSKSWNVDPEFENRDQDDYRLKSTSPLIDKGAWVDLRYSGQAPEIGAFEFLPPPAIPDT